MENIIIEEVIDIGDIFDLINDNLQPENWNIADIVKGKEIDVFPEWKSLMDQVVWDYRDVGWEVFHYLHGDREFLCFSAPKHWRKK
jgi:hypothetical protein